MSWRGGVLALRVYTRTGDKGETSLAGGRRVPKDHPRIEVLGALDEAFSCLGLARSLCGVGERAEVVAKVQAVLVEIMSSVAGFATPLRPEERVAEVEGWIDDLEFEREVAGLLLGRERGFWLFGEDPAGSALQLARALLRRAERELVGASKSEDGLAGLVPLINRLSDLLFVLGLALSVEAWIRRFARVLSSCLIQELGGEVRKEMGCGSLSLEEAMRLIASARRRAEELGVPMVIAVVDGAGFLLAFQRMDGALLVSCDLAVKKAKTAALIRKPTHVVAELVQPGAMLYGFASYEDFCSFGGGLPVERGGKVVGGIGVSGGTVEQDVDVAYFALSSFGG